MALEDVEVITIFVDKATVWILVLNKNMATGELEDPTAVKIDTIYNPQDEPEEEDKSMTKYNGNTGIYEYLFHKGEDTEALAVGKWRGEGRVIDGVGADAIITPFDFSFEVGE